MERLQKFLEMLSDCIFPPSEDALRVRTLTEDTVTNMLSFDVYQGVHTLYVYKDTLIRSAIWQLKYHDDRRVARLFGTALRRTFLDDITTPHLLIPIPLAPKRFRERGYNQVERIAIPATQNHLYVTLTVNTLCRNKNAPSQTRLGRQDRLKNLSSAFVITDPARIYNKDIILLDDVVTTGSTLHSARNILLKAGAKSVTMIALAH